MAAARRSVSARVALPEPDPERLAQASELAERAPLPARVGRILTGTAGWTDRTLVQSKTFYPSGVSSAEERLRHYAAHFPLVEVDATYYSLLPPTTSQRWLEWTPLDFRFDVKAFPVLTGHPIDVTRLPADLRAACVASGHERRVYPDALEPELKNEMIGRFLDFVAPLYEAGRLGAVCLQYPPWFTATRKNARHIEETRRALPEALPLAIEFRHPSWFVPERRERVRALLASIDASFVCTDAPSESIGSILVTSPRLAIVRFHGRNVQGFFKRGASVMERFDYLYVPDELRSWMAPLRTLSENAEAVHAVFNNCVRNYAVLNAKDLAALLSAEQS